MKRLFSTLILLATTLITMAQGWPNDYKGVMLQSFYWNSFEDTQWTKLEKQAGDLASSFDLIWIPQSGNCGSTSMGYDDLWWFSDYNSSFGSENQLRSMINSFNRHKRVVRRKRDGLALASASRRFADWQVPAACE